MDHETQMPEAYVKFFAAVQTKKIALLVILLAPFFISFFLFTTVRGVDALTESRVWFWVSVIFNYLTVLGISVGLFINARNSRPAGSTFFERNVATLSLSFVLTTLVLLSINTYLWLAILWGENKLLFFVGFAVVAFFAILPMIVDVVIRHKNQKRYDAFNAKYASVGPYVLYLRPFRFDHRVVVKKEEAPNILLSSSESYRTYRTFEEIIAKFCYNAKIPLLAISDKSRRSFGATKIESTKDDWQALVQSKLAVCSSVVFVPGAYRGTLWEAGEIMRLAKRKTFFVMPPQMKTNYNFDFETEWTRLSEEVSECWGITLPSYNPTGCIFMIRSDNSLLFFSLEQFLGALRGIHLAKVKTNESARRMSETKSRADAAMSSLKRMSQNMPRSEPEAPVDDQ